jgi:hypothetical protein
MLVAQRAKPFGAAVRQVGAAALVAARDERSLAGFVSVPGGRPGRAGELAVSSLAAALAAKPEPVDQLPDLAAAPAMGWLVARPSSFAQRDTEAAGDPSEVAATLARVMSPGAWVAVSLRAASRAEWSRARRWYEHRLAGGAAHYSREGEVVVGSIFAGASSGAEVEAILLQLAAAIPGFDLDVAVRRAGRAAPAGALTAAGLAGLFGAGIGADQWALGAAGLGAFGVASAATAAGWVPTRSVRVGRALAAGRPPSPARRFLAPRRHRSERTQMLQDGRVVHQQPSRGGWPLAPSTLLLSPAMVVGAVAPHGATATEAAATRMRRAPSALAADIGPLVGYAGDDSEPVHIDAGSLWEGLALIGLAGSGKSTCLASLFGWSLLERVSPSGKSGRPGKANTVIAIESKGEGAEGYRRWVEATGDEWALIEVADPCSPVIDLFDVPGTEGGAGPASATDQAEFFVNAMTYAFPAGDIQGRARETLTAVLTAALVAIPDVVAAAGLDRCASPVELAYVLAGGHGDEAGTRLAAALAQGAAQAPDGPTRAELAAAVRGLAILYESKVTPTQRRTVSESSRSRLADLLKARSWWSVDRPKVSWRTILDQHWCAVVNTGVTASGQIAGEQTAQLMAAMLTYALRAAIMATCSSWRAQGRSVSVFADELALLAGSSPDVVAWLRNQGRSYGVRCVFAAQYPEQLQPAVRDCLLGFSTIFWFRQNNPQVVQAAVSQLSMVGGDWSAADVAGLEPYHAILLAVADGRMQPAVPIRVAFWSGDLGRFAAAQGYPARSLRAPEPVPPPALVVSVAPVIDPSTSRADPYSTGGQPS